MNAFVPSGLASVSLLVALLLATLGLGFAITRLGAHAWARAAAWGLAAVAVACGDRMAAKEPAGLRMLALIGVLLFAMKAVVCVEAQARQGVRLTALRWLMFAGAWPGMRPAVFARRGRGPLPGAGGLCARGVALLGFGAALLAAARLLWAATGSRAGATALLLPGLSLMLHFGLFNLAAGFWRWVGFDCEPLFRAPLLSRSLGEFWGRRWNRGFSEMTTAAVYRPVSGASGRSAGLVAAFFCSGLLHEVAISLPVRGGFGLPFTYFAIHAGLVLVERARVGTGDVPDGKPWIGRAWTALCLLLPLPLLFHRPFLEGIVWPLLVQGP